MVSLKQINYIKRLEFQIEKKKKKLNWKKRRRNVRKLRKGMPGVRERECDLCQLCESHAQRMRVGRSDWCWWKLYFTIQIQILTRKKSQWITKGIRKRKWNLEQHRLQKNLNILGFWTLSQTKQDISRHHPELWDIFMGTVFQFSESVN